MRWLLQSQFDQNHHLINHTPNGDFKSHIIFLWTLNVHVELLMIFCDLLKIFPIFKKENRL